MPCAYCGCVGYHTWAGSGGCPGAVSDRDRDRAAASQLRALELELQNYKTQNAALRALCGQAADALAYYCKEVKSLSLQHYELIEELRHARGLE